MKFTDIDHKASYHIFIYVCLSVYINCVSVWQMTYLAGVSCVFSTMKLTTLVILEPFKPSC